LLAACRADDARRPDGMTLTIAEAFALEPSRMRPLPERDFACCVTRPVTLNPYSQVTFETNRYSVPVEEARRTLTLKAYPFRIEILSDERVIASHPRCYARARDLFDPCHYLPLLEQRPGAFEHARPLREWRATWPDSYEKLLSRLQADSPDGRGVREFIRVLQLHRQHPAALIEQAVSQALAFGCAHAEGVVLCLNQLLQPAASPPVLDLTERPRLQGVGVQPIDLRRYEALLVSQGG